MMPATLPGVPAKAGIHRMAIRELADGAVCKKPAG